MGNAVTKIPEDSTILCETCGYDLTGVPESGKCPECGHEIAESLPEHRGLPVWERNQNVLLRFWQTTMQVLFMPRRFYRTLMTRRPGCASRSFALIHWIIASLLFGWAAFVHVKGFIYVDLTFVNWLLRNPIYSIVIFGGITFLMFAVTTPIAARLTAWEGQYRGLRLPLSVVQRGLDYHAADYLPVALISFITIAGYRWLVDRRLIDSAFDAKYLYILCGEVIAGAAYLFNAYWIGMRNMMYANG